jgi:hypothetical protein
MPVPVFNSGLRILAFEFALMLASVERDDDDRLELEMLLSASE